MRDRIFFELARDLSSSLEVDVVLQRVMDRVISLMKASRGFIVLVDATGTMSVQMSGGDTDPEKSKEFLDHGAEIYKVEQGAVDPRIAADD